MARIISFLKSCGAPQSWAPILAAALLASGCGTTTQTPSEQRHADVSTAALTQSQRQDYQTALRRAARGDYSTAAAALDALSEQQPQHPGVWINLAAAHYQMDNVEKAQQSLAKAGALAPDNALVENLKGSLALHAGEVDEAEQHFQSALSYNPTLAEAHYNLALLYDTYYQAIPDAIEHYQAYLKLTPENDEDTERWLQQLQRSLNR